MKYISGQFHQQILTGFSLEQDENLFSAHTVWLMANKFGKKHANLSFKFGVLIIRETEQQIFHARASNFSLGKKKVW